MSTKNRYVLNPKSNRMVRVGGKPWRVLVKQGLADYIPPKERWNAEANTVAEFDSPEDAKVAQKHYRAKAKSHTKRKASKVVRVQTAPKQEEVAQFAAKCATRTVHKNMVVLEQKLDSIYDNADGGAPSEEDLQAFEDELRDLILADMIKPLHTKTRAPVDKGRQRRAALEKAMFSTAARTATKQYAVEEDDFKEDDIDESAIDESAEEFDE